MKRLHHLLYLQLIVIFIGCGHHQTKTPPTSAVKAAMPIVACDSVVKVDIGKDRDTIFLNHDQDDPFWVTKGEMERLIKRYPELGDSTFVHSPDEALAICNTRDHLKPCYPNKFDCELCRDLFFKLYAYLLKQHDVDQPNNGKRDTLIKLYSDINVIQGKLCGGGTGFGHMARRIPGYVEYAIYQSMGDKVSLYKYPIIKQKTLYINALQQRINDETDGNNELLGKEKIKIKRELLKTVNEIDGLITNYFYLSNTQRFQYSNY